MGHIFETLFKIQNKWINILINSLFCIFLMTILIIISLFVNIPNPNLIVLCGLLIASLLFGYIPGGLCLIMFIIFNLYFFSEGHNFINYTDINVKKIIVSFITSIFCYIVFATFHYYDCKLYYKLKNLSNTDHLTNIKNRLGFKQDIKTYVNKKINLAVFDVDDFKKINDIYGHEIGDEVLINVAKLMSNYFGNDSCYRFGGDEFVIVIPNMELENFKMKYEDFKTKVAELMILDININTKLSAGLINGNPNSKEEIKNMLKNADDLLYKAKRTGKNSIAVLQMA